MVKRGVQVGQTRKGGWSKGGPRAHSGEGEGRWEGGVPRGCRRRQVGTQGQEGGPRVVQGVQGAQVRERRQRRGSEVARLQGSG